MDTQLESQEQYLWIEANAEWLKSHRLYKSPPRSKEEAEVILYALFHGCSEIKRPPQRERLPDFM